MVQIYVSRGKYTGYQVVAKVAGVYEADANIDLNGNDLTDVDDIDFLQSGQAINTDTSGIHITLPTSDLFDITINSGLEYDFTATELDLHGNDLDAIGTMTFDSVGTGGTSTVTISSLTGSLHYNVPSTDNHFFKVNGTTIVDIDENRLDINDHFLQMTEMTPPAGSSNIAKIYADDNGAGKTRLLVVFGTGAPIQLAIQV